MIRLIRQVRWPNLNKKVSDKPGTVHYEVGAIKPESQIYQYLIDKLQCHAKDILFIGDTLLADYSGPTEFGMSARLIDRKSGQKLADVLADIIR